MKRKLLIFSLAMLASAGISQAGTGQSGWTVMRKARSAKFKPVATTPVMAVRGDLSGVFYNPAVLGLNPAMELFMLSEIGIADDSFAGLVYGHPFEKGSWAVGIIYYSAGDMDLNWFEGGSLKSETVKAQKDTLALASCGLRLGGGIAAGITLKAAKSELFERASAAAFAADIGFLYSPPEMENLSFAGALQNIGTSTKFVRKANPLPAAASLSAAYWIDIGEYYFTPGLDITYIIREQRFTPEIGFEAGTGPISLNLGYRISVSEASWHFGLTWLQDRYDIAYAFLPGFNLEPTHRISVGYRFGWYTPRDNE